MAERQRDPAKVQLKNVRLSYAAIYRAKAFGGGKNDDGGEPKFSANFLIDPESREGKVNVQKMDDAIDHVIKNTDWGGKTPKFPASKLPLRDGDDADKDEYEGMMFVSASNAKKPRVLDADKLDVQEGDDGAPYSGCYVDAIVRVWGQNNKWGKRVNASLEGVRFRDDGEAFGAAPLDPDEFDDDDDRGSSRRSSGRGRDKDEGDDRGSSRRSSSRGRAPDDEPEERGSRRSSRDDDPEERGSRRSSRDRDEEPEERGSRRRSSRDEEPEEREERGSRRSSRDRDEEPEERGSRRRSSRDEEPEDRGSRRSSRDRDEPDERTSRRSRRSREDDDLA